MIVIMTLIEKIIKVLRDSTIITRRTITMTLQKESSTIKGRLNVFLLLVLGGIGFKGIFHVMRIDTRMRDREWEGDPIAKVPI